MNNRIYRSTSEQVLGGVAAGLARAWHVDTAWVRLGLVLGAILTHGALLGVYLLLWAVLPSPASTASDVGGVVSENINEVAARVGIGPITAPRAPTSDASVGSAASVVEPPTTPATQASSSTAWGPGLARLLIFGTLIMGFLSLGGFRLFHWGMHTGMGHNGGSFFWPVIVLVGIWWFLRHRRTA